MNQDKRTLLPGLSLFVCFCLLTGMEKLITHFNLPPSLMALGEIVCFGLALAMALPGMDRERFKQRLAFKMPRKGGWLLILFMGAATAFAALSLNMLEYRLLAHTGLRLTIASLPMPLGGMSFAWRLLIGVVIAALVEEIYLRGALFSVYGEEVGTSACLLFGGIVFALLHGSPLDLAAGFCASFSIEFCQLFVNRSTDVDDLILNTLGAFAGGLIALLLRRLAPRFTKRFQVEVQHGRETGDPGPAPGAGAGQL